MIPHKIVRYLYKILDIYTWGMVGNENNRIPIYMFVMDILLNSCRAISTSKMRIYIYLFGSTIHYMIHYISCFVQSTCHYMFHYISRVIKSTSHYMFHFVSCFVQPTSHYMFHRSIPFGNSLLPTRYFIMYPILYRKID